MGNFINTEKKKIRARLNDVDFMLQDLVDESGMSRSRYIRTFNEAFGTTPMSYVGELRLKQAAKMIRNTNKSMKEISKLCGFTDRHYFCHCFKIYYKMTATEYRKQMSSK